MAHFAKIEEGVVVQVMVVSNRVVLDSDGIESEQLGIDWCVDFTGGGEWVQTSYNTCANTHRLDGVPLRKNFAGIGYSYDKERDAFLPPQPYPAWPLDEETGQWKPPAPYPSDGEQYSWSEEAGEWVEAIS